MKACPSAPGRTPEYPVPAEVADVSFAKLALNSRDTCEFETTQDHQKCQVTVAN